MEVINSFSKDAMKNVTWSLFFLRVKMDVGYLDKIPFTRPRKENNHDRSN